VTTDEEFAREMFKAQRCVWCKIGAPDCEVEGRAGKVPGHRGRSMVGVPCDVYGEWLARGWVAPPPKEPAKS